MKTKSAGIMMFLFVSACFFSTVHAEKLNMCESEWPSFEIPAGMGMLGQLNDFNIVHEKYETCLFGLKKGKYDITFLTLFEFIGVQQESPNSVIIGAVDYSNGGDMIVLRPEITTASALKGRQIALQTDTLSLQLLNLYLVKNGLTLDDVKPVHIGVENISKAFLATRSLAGIVGWNPLTHGAVAAGGTIAATSRDFPEKIIDVMAVSRSSLQKNRAVYRDFLKKWFAAIHNPAVLEKTAEHAKMPVNEFKKELENAYLYPDISASLQAFAKMKEAAREIQALFKTRPANIPGSAAHLFGKEPLNADSWFDDSLLKELVNEQTSESVSK